MPKYLKDLTSLNSESQIDANLEFVSVLGDGNEKLIPRDLLVSYFGKAISPLDKLSFDTTPTGSLSATGDVIWNDAEETLAVQLHGFAMNLGQHMVYHVKNNTASTIGMGVPVMFNGTSGASGKLHVTPWNPTSPATRFMGLTTEELSVGEEGFVIAFGKLRNIQTDGNNYGETWADGDIIYASPDTIGYLTNVQPTAPDPIIEVMAVVHAAANNGNVFVRPTYAQGPQGTPGQDALWNFTGAYGAGTAYSVGDVATYDGETWYRINANGGNVGDTPAEGTFWTKLAAKGAGGGSGDFLPLAGGTMDANATITWSNFSAIREAGTQGLEIECSVGYRWQWVAGRMILRQINSGQIQRVLAIDGVTPGNTEDISEGFIVGTRWETQDGTIYECTDSTDGAAVWVNTNIHTPSVAYVNTYTGNNTNGVIGDPDRPYYTAQAAWDDGARNIVFGVGSYTITHISSPSDSFDIFFRGAGKEATTLDFTFTGTTGIDGIDQTDAGQPGGDATAGGNAGSFTLASDKSLSINLVASGGLGGTGGTGGPGSSAPEIIGGNGGDGGATGNGPNFEVFNCVLISVNNIVQGGQAGPGGDANGYIGGIAGSAGADGTFGTEHYYWCDIESNLHNIVSNDMDACLKDGYLFADVPSDRVQYGASSVQSALDTLFDGNVEIYRINDNNWVTTSSTLANVSNLTCSVAANEQLTIEIFGYHTAGTGGMKISFSGPGAPTFLRYNFSHWTTVTAMRSPIPGAATDFNVELTEGAGSTVVMPFSVLLTLKNGSTPGPIQFRAASVTGGQTLTLMRETVMRVTR